MSNFLVKLQYPDLICVSISPQITLALLVLLTLKLNHRERILNTDNIQLDAMVLNKNPVYSYFLKFKS